MSPPVPGWIPLVALGAVLVAVAVSDVRHRRIPNLLVVIVAAGGLVHAALVDGARGALWSTVGGVAGLALLFVPAATGLVGAGDWKLVGGLGTWCGALGAVYVTLYGAVLNGVLALLALLLLDRAQRAEVWQNVFLAVVNREVRVPEPSKVARARGVPFGVSLGLTAVGYLYLRMGR